jgi:hypothetical protein
MTERRLQENQFDIVLEQLTRVGDELEQIRHRLDALDALPETAHQIQALSRSLESLAYAALGREGPHIVRRRG